MPLRQLKNRSSWHGDRAPRVVRSRSRLRTSQAQGPESRTYSDSRFQMPPRQPERSKDAPDYVRYRLLVGTMEESVTVLRLPRPAATLQPETPFASRGPVAQSKRARFLFGRRIRNGENCGFTALLQSGLPSFHYAKGPSRMAFSRFQPDNTLRRLIKEDREALSFSGDGADQGQERSTGLVNWRRRLRLDRSQLDNHRWAS